MSSERAKEAYDKIQGQLAELARQPMSIANWTSACAIMAKGLRVATIAKEEDVSTLSFYRTRLKYLRRELKEVSVEQALVVGKGSEFVDTASLIQLRGGGGCKISGLEFVYIHVSESFGSRDRLRA